MNPFYLKYRLGNPNQPYYPLTVSRTNLVDGRWETDVLTWVRIYRDGIWYDVKHWENYCSKDKEESVRGAHKNIMENAYYSQLYYQIRPNAEFNPESPIQVDEHDRLR